MSGSEQNRIGEGFMRAAIEEARLAAALGEVPVGAVVVWEGRIVGRGHNLRECSKNALTHAELIAIDMACRTLGGWRLHKADLYVTLEPCPMCAGAAINARIRRVIYGAADPKAGSFGSLADFTKIAYNHAPKIVPGLLEEECAILLTHFFQELRRKRRQAGSNA